MKTEKLQIYNGMANQYNRELKKLEEADISQKNKELIKLFHNNLFSKGCGNSRIVKLSWQLRSICRWLDKALHINRNLDKLEKKDIESLVAFINRLENISEATKSDYKRVIKQFFHWFKEDDNRLYSKNEKVSLETKNFYKCVESIKKAYKKNKIDPATIITDSDIELVVSKGCKTHKEKAFLMLLHELGTRAEEFLNLKIGNITIKDNYAEIMIPFGKTGERIIYAVKSLPYIIRYLEIHPFKDETNSYLWISEARSKDIKPLLYKGGLKLINRCFEKAKCSKRHNWHWFRHSRASILAPQITQPMLCKYMGWELDSDMVRNYAHLCNQQLEDVFLKLNGVKQKDEQQQELVRCVCGTLNNVKERYCYKCFKPLSVEVVVQDKAIVNTEINKTIQFMMEMVKDPELMKRFEDFKKNLPS